MGKLKKGLLVFVFLIIILIIAFIIYRTHQKPKYEGEVYLKNIQKETTVYFDEFGVPHIYAANQKDAMIALQTGDLEVFGKLMYASHQSLKELYEVSGKELDTIVDFCKTFKGCIGARMTGAGFGGCAIALVKKNSMEDFVSKLKAYYKNETGYNTDVFASVIDDGVRRI